MDIVEKLKILSDAAKYDVSCSSSGSSRKNVKDGIGNASPSGICHSFTSDGRCISLLKILLTNYCVYNCVYCINRNTNDVPRAAFTPDEVADLTINFYKRNYIEGLFLSSGVFKNPNYTMELLIQTVKKLRKDYKFNGYIHIKAIPGADEHLIKEAGLYTDRMSVNIELPSDSSLKLLAPQKNKVNILKPMGIIKDEIATYKYNKGTFKNSPVFVPAGQSTQLIVGATPDSDLKIIKLSEGLYNKYNLKRVYYSAYVPISKNPVLAGITNPPLLREHRLYQADWLLRFYGFSASELLNEASPNFNTDFDPKTNWALNNLHLFPLEINTASYEMLLRVPGIGVKSAKRILSIRKVHYLTFEDIKKIGIVLKRARYFLTCKGKYYGDIDIDSVSISNKLVSKPIIETLKDSYQNFEQLSMFSNVPAIYDSQDYLSRIFGQF
jgi:putative DNA modification/repair radical SAM protein